MTFPETPLAILGQMQIDGTWTDITDDIRARDGISINRGRQNEQGRVGPSTCNFSLNNRDGKYSNRNPLSPYYGLIPRNTPVRVFAGAIECHLNAYGNVSGAYVRTADKAALDILGDIDIRMDIQPDKWADGTTHSLVSKYLTTGNQRSWGLSLRGDNKLVFQWTTDGTSATLVSATSSALPTTLKRLSIRVFLDVNNGAAGRTTTFYYSTDTDLATATWTQLGSPVTTAGVTSIFNSTATLDIGSANNGQPTFFSDSNFPARSFDGKIYNFELRNSAGTLVAKTNFKNSAALSLTSFADGLGNTWSVTGDNWAITTDNLRFTGELSELPVRWDKSGTDVYVPVTASGMIRRLTQGASPLRSPIYRHLTSTNTNANGYWPFEDESLATRASAGIAGHGSASATDVSFGAEDTLPGTAGVARLTAATSRIQGTAKNVPTTTTASAVFYFKMTAVPAGDTNILTFYSTGTIKQLQVIPNAGSYRFIGYDNTGASVLDTSIIFGGAAYEPDNWMAMTITLAQSGANVNYSFYWHPVGSTSFIGAGSSYVGTVGRFTGFLSTGSTAAIDMMLAHVLMSTSSIPFASTFASASNAFQGEDGATRIARICGEEDIPVRVRGTASDSELMGRQPIDSLMNIVYDAADTDGGQLFESPDELSLEYRTRTSLYNQDSFDVVYTDSILSEVPEPVEDDQLVVNDVTVSRPGGSSARSTKESGPLSVLSSPDGIGRYDSSVTRNVYLDSRLDDQAEWLVNLGTWDEARYPRVTVNLARNALVDDPGLTASFVGAEIGDYLSLTDLPSFLPPGPVDLMIQGSREFISQFEWTIELNCSPYGPYKVGIVTNTNSDVYLDSEVSAVNTAINSTATSLSVKTTGRLLWTTTSVDFDIMVAGERMSVTAISGSSSPQTFTVTRSVNGIVKSHSVDEPVSLADPTLIGL